jgi:predicted TIM-barrel fold metal-dependent hydrolase
MAHAHVQTRSARLREEMGHPVLDGDGHIVELMAVFVDYVRDHGHGNLLSGFLNRPRAIEDLTLEERRAGGVLPNSWHVPSKADYYATVTSPRRYHDRLGEAGIDFAVLYASCRIALVQSHGQAERWTLCRRENEILAEQYGLTAIASPSPLVPMHTPEAKQRRRAHQGARVEGGADPESRALTAPGQPAARRPGWAIVSVGDARVGRHLGIDSIHDYDPVWAKAVELGLPLWAHTAGMGASDRSSMSSFVFNQIGHFAASGGALAKSLFLGGVTARFPQLRVALLEGGAAVGVEVYIGLVTTWQKRGGEAIAKLDPENLDKELVKKLLVEDDPRLAKYSPTQLAGGNAGMTRARDDFAAVGLTSIEDIRDQFCTSFSWGCEADDPLVGLAFDSRVTPLGAHLPAMFASDLGHWDVPDFDEPLEEAFELVERGILDAESFRKFVFTNPLRFYGSLDPAFFCGTVIEDEAAAALADA